MEEIRYSLKKTKKKIKSLDFHNSTISGVGMLHRSQLVFFKFIYACCKW